MLYIDIIIIIIIIIIDIIIISLSMGQWGNIHVSKILFTLISGKIYMYRGVHMPQLAPLPHTLWITQNFFLKSKVYLWGEFSPNCPMRIVLIWR